MPMSDEHAKAYIIQYLIQIRKGSVFYIAYLFLKLLPLENKLSADNETNIRLRQSRLDYRNQLKVNPAVWKFSTMLLQQVFTSRKLRV